MTSRAVQAIVGRHFFEDNMNMNMSNELVHNGKITKVDRYGWTVQDIPGEMRMISKHELHVDRTYQRNTNEAKLIHIAKEWSWIACGAIVVANREGVLFVIDGQHRVMAAKKRADITNLPCIMFRTTGAQQEAKGFLTAQTQRKAVTAAEKLRALITVADPAAMMLQELIEMAGRTPSGGGGPTGVKCVGVLLRWANKEPEILRHVWPLIAEVSQGKTLHERIVDGLLHIETRLPPGVSLMDKEWRRRVNKTGVESLLDGAAKAAALYAKGGPKVWATGMIEAINRGHRNRLELAE